MIINKKRIISGKYFASIREDTDICIKVNDVNRFTHLLREFGFEEGVSSGTTILPSKINKFALRNAEQFFTINKKLPKEEYIQTLYWTRTEWAGRGETREVTEFVDIKRLRYHRDWHNPYNVCFTILYDESGNVNIVSGAIKNDAENLPKLINTVNMLLSIFGECEICGQEEIRDVKRIHLNWTLLPPGKYPWSDIERIITARSASRNKSEKTMMLRNCNKIYSCNPDFIAYGTAGFTGYVIFGFEAKDIYILESSIPNNATYVLSGDWKSISKLSKAEILNNSLHKARIIHNCAWEENFNKIIGEFI